jgi:zinc transport system permease protein
MSVWDAFATTRLLQYAVICALLASIACGVIGTYVVVKRISFISGGIAHAVLGGMGLAYFFGANPLHGAIASALLAAMILGVVSLRARQHEDTLIGALWSVGMAIGIIFIYKTPGYSQNLLSYLFGNILMVSGREIIYLAVLDLLILAMVMAFYNRFLGVCFDEEYCRIQGMNVDAVYLLLLCLIALTVVILVQVVGIVMVVAMLTLPAAIAGQWMRSLKQMMGMACVVGGLVSLTGLVVSYPFNLPAGATIVLVAGVAYLGSTLIHLGR